MIAFGGTKGGKKVYRNNHVSKKHGCRSIIENSMTIEWRCFLAKKCKFN
jgi:hypothetical protein